MREEPDWDRGRRRAVGGRLVSSAANTLRVIACGHRHRRADHGDRGDRRLAERAPRIADSVMATTARACREARHFAEPSPGGEMDGESGGVDALADGSGAGRSVRYCGGAPYGCATFAEPHAIVVSAVPSATAPAIAITPAPQNGQRASSR
jgi:hypothetical protein